jgi:hypothetical protein
MKALLFVLSLLILQSSFCQKSEELVPSEAVTVFSLNNIKLLQKISLDQLVQYDFMEELQQELFDGSTNEKTIKDSGLDFDQKLNVFLGKNNDYSLSGITFGIENKSNLFLVFDDFKPIESSYKGVEWYDSYLNNLLIKEKCAILLRIEPNERKIDLITDSIWYARGNGSPWGEYNIEEEVVPYEIDTLDNNDEDEPEEIEEVEPVESLMKNYYELRDSVQFTLQQEYEKQVLDELFLSNKRLIVTDPRFSEQISHETEGTFYFDYSRKLDKKGNLFYFSGVLPNIYSEIHELYTDNIILGDLVLVDDHLEFQVETRYNEKLGAIYSKLTDAKLDNSVRKYIHENCPAYFIYKVNLREAYEKAFEIIMPILSKEEKDKDLISNALLLDLINEFVNKDAVFDTYKGSLFGSFNGVKKIKTKKIEFIYDEQTFDYYEKETEAEEDMPIFTFGINTKRPDIPEKLLNYISKILSTRKDVNLYSTKKGKEILYYTMEKAIFNAAPVYFINKNGLFIITNDEDLAKNYSDGYEDKAISNKSLKKAQQGGLLYAKMDLNSTVNLFPRDIFSAKENEVIDALRGSTGQMEIASDKTTTKNTKINLTYDFKADQNGPGKHVLELINAMYVLIR